MSNHASPTLIPFHPAPVPPGLPRHHDPGGEGSHGAAHGLYQATLRPRGENHGWCLDRQGRVRMSRPPHTGNIDLTYD